MKSEAEVQYDIFMAAPTMGLRLLRNNSGAMVDESGNWVRYGVGKGGSDDIGFYSHTCLRTGDLSGGYCTVPVFTAVEVKREDWKPPSDKAMGEDAKRYRKQRDFIAAVKRAGGIACFATCVQDVADAIEAWRREH